MDLKSIFEDIFIDFIHIEDNVSVNCYDVLFGFNRDYNFVYKEIFVLCIRFNRYYNKDNVDKGTFWRINKLKL